MIKDTNPTAVAQFFKKYGEQLTLRKGTIFQPEVTTREVIYVEQGHVSGSLQNQNQMLTRFVFGAGDIINLQILVVPLREDVQYHTMSLAKVYVVPKEKVLKELDTDINLAKTLLSSSLIQNAHRAERTENLLYKFVSDRIIYRLLFLAERFGESDSKHTGYIKLTVAKLDIANAIGSTRETVSRELLKLEHEGLISYTRRQVVIHDVHKLIGHLHEELRTDWSAFAADTKSAT